MKPILTTALALVMAASAAPAAAQYGSSGSSAPQQSAQASSQGQAAAQNGQQAPSIKPSKPALNAIVALQDAVNKKDYASVPGLVAAAKTVATTKEDRYLIGTFDLKAAIGTNDFAKMRSAIDFVASSGYLTPAKTADLYSGLGGSLIQAKQYAPAAAAYRRAIELNPSDTESQRLMVMAMFYGGQKAEAAAATGKLISDEVAAGRKPSEDLYRLAVQAAADSNSSSVLDLSKQWLSAYPSADSWRTTLSIAKQMHAADLEDGLALDRLMSATNALSANDYKSYVQLLIDQSNFNEAHSVVDAGIAAKAINSSDGWVAMAQGKPQATAADLAAASKTAQTGMALLRIGDRYYGLGDYSRAVELYRQAQGKGVDAPLANLHIGMALARAGDKAGATAAFNAVTGPRAEIAKIWLTYLAQKA